MSWSSFLIPDGYFFEAKWLDQGLAWDGCAGFMITAAMYSLLLINKSAAILSMLLVLSHDECLIQGFLNACPR